MNNEIITFDQFVNNKRINEKIPNNPDSYGDEIGISTKNSHLPLDQPQDGPTGDIVMSAYANLNVPTRKVPNTDYGNLGCAAAVSIIFYRSTGYPLVPKKQIELSTSNLWRSLNKSRDWEKISDWRSQYQPGDIIITARGKKAGHVGVVVDGGKIISNSSGGFQGDQKGQIEMNYSISSWDSVAQRNPQQTALFRYIGPYADKWGDIPPSNKGVGSNDLDQIKMDIELPEIVVVGVNKSKLDTVRIDVVKPSQLIDNNGSPDLLKSGNQPDKK